MVGKPGFVGRVLRLAGQVVGVFLLALGQREPPATSIQSHILCLFVAIHLWYSAEDSHFRTLHAICGAAGALYVQSGQQKEGWINMDLSDGQLLALYRKGDAEALDTLVRRYKKQLFGFIINMMEGGGDADEIFQEVWFKAIRKIDQYREKNFLAWLIRIARNTIIDRWRAGRKFVRQNETAHDATPVVEQIADGLPDPGRNASARDLGRRISDAIALLPVEQREVVTMRVYSELQFKEIARVQGVSINTALARMQYGLAKLRETLQDDYTTLKVQ